jgi:hypothetical protein
VRKIGDGPDTATLLPSPSGSINAYSVLNSRVDTPTRESKSISTLDLASDGQLREHDRSWMKEECSLSEMLRGDTTMSYIASGAAQRIETFLLGEKTEEEIAFQSTKAAFKDRCLKIFNGLLFSDYPLPNATHSCAKLQCTRQSGKVHLIICVHGLEGTHEDMKLVW